jgi:hypothetical protein
MKNIILTFPFMHCTLIRRVLKWYVIMNGSHSIERSFPIVKGVYTLGIYHIVLDFLFFWGGGEGHFARGKGVGGPKSYDSTETLVLFIHYSLYVSHALKICFCRHSIKTEN